MDKLINEDGNLILPIFQNSRLEISISTDIQNECNDLFISSMNLDLKAEETEFAEFTRDLTKQYEIIEENEISFEKKSELAQNEQIVEIKKDSITLSYGLIDLSDNKLDTKCEFLKEKQDFLFSSGLFPESTTSHQYLINQLTNNNQQNADISSGTNPKKNFPIPVSRFPKIEVDNEKSSCDGLSYQSGFKSANKNESSSKSSKKITKIRKSEPEKIEKISVCLDKCLKQLKSQILNEFDKKKYKIVEGKQKKLFEEQERQSAEIIRLKKENEVLKETIKINEKKLLKNEIIIDKNFKVIEKQREKNDIQRVMMEWKYKRLEKVKEDFTVKIADKYYAQRLKMGSFFNWKSFLLSKRKENVEKACKKKAEEVCCNLTAKYSNQIQELEETINSNRLEIEKYKAEIAISEENIRKVIIRGVKALNTKTFNENSSFAIKSNKIYKEVFANNLVSDYFGLAKYDLCTNNSNLDKDSHGNSLLHKKNIFSLSTVAKAKLRLLNINSKNTEPSDQLMEKNIQEDILQNNRLFYELTQNSNIRQQKDMKAKPCLKSKSKSVWSNSFQLSYNLPHRYTSVVIEKHTKK